MPVIKNAEIQAVINTKGAELSSLIFVENNLEYIWQADKDIWPRHAPVLFPIVGRLKYNAYKTGNENYSMSQHGFARDMEFTVTEHTPDSIRLTLTDNENSRKIYPFAFNLDIEYKLKCNTIEIKNTVTNTGENTLLFSIGAHPGFNTPLTPDTDFEDYFLEFDTDNNIERCLLSDGLLSGNTETVAVKNKQLQLHTSLFEKDAIVVKNPEFETVTIRNTKNTHYVKLHSGKVPYYGIWAKPNTRRFVCLEPWQGITSSVTTPDSFAEKEGIIHLYPAKDFKFAYSIEIG